jgi:hypothetical protein
MDDDDRDWPFDSTGTIEGTCERCGERRPLRCVHDPFARERIIDRDPDETHRWCKPCLELRRDDV